MKLTSCGVIVVADGRMLLGQTTRSPRWDIPKGVAEAGETWLGAAVRELREETGLVAPPGDLVALGAFDYLPRKQLALFAWHPDAPLDPAALRCTAMVETADGPRFPELARFALCPWDEALARVGKNLARVLISIGPDRVFL